MDIPDVVQGAARFNHISGPYVRPSVGRGHDGLTIHVHDFANRRLVGVKANDADLTRPGACAVGVARAAAGHVQRKASGEDRVPRGGLCVGRQVFPSGADRGVSPPDFDVLTGKIGKQAVGHGSSLGYAYLVNPCHLRECGAVTRLPGRLGFGFFADPTAFVIDSNATFGSPQRTGCASQGLRVHPKYL